jgi:hypothetical protein
MIGRAPSYYHTVVGRSGRLFKDDGLDVYIQRIF